MVLRAAYFVTALKLQEAADAADTPHSNVRSRLSDAIAAAHKGTGSYAYYQDHTGDGEAGSVVYSVNGEMKQAPYAIEDAKGKASTSVDTAKAFDVVPKVSYLKHAAKATEAEAPKPEAPDEALKLFESATPLEAIVIREAKADYEIKLIAPGKGSSAFYPAEVLKRDGPGVFKAGTQVFLNHQTAAEEAARPEGDVKNLAGVLTRNAVYYESHAKGPGLYGHMKVFADHGAMVEEKAAHVGMSIRANGIAESGTKRDGLPVLKAFTSAESVDVVTRAGAGGMILTESAAGAAIPKEASDMDAEELKTLKESVAAQAVMNQKLLDRALRGDALIEATRALASITLPEASKQRVIDSVLREAIPVTAAGELDTVKFTEAVGAEAKREGAYVAGLTHAGRVTGMGVAAPVETKEALKPEEINARSVEIFKRLGLSESAAKAAVKGRAA